ncbi:TetR family transcriptional regulator [Gordonia amarae]|uniref:TetR family transcriptional regulator n=2 Tax=Gordonia amarae TaxID=36821 RepID=A0A857KUS8_9ACTN|nr:TetR/AcrR family transcriptional regulator [Gordonia amarae]MCS3877800.1 AcrR family transcriptional regulator [Gordonia amarae]QHN16492.1 TetR family transcriptional regulator [Gordonia amarae]QHN21061.1 TetR family transcriptional regulator [Gordonia amarae]QHN29912.1 TetR family transcriptional regulator [Gordonia amarae]QHN38688.1 TetR family transcriptional regulator [Gordonia amarae]
MTDPAPAVFDRRSPTRGDQRRANLLRALHELLQSRTFEQINIADITSAAGVSRSGFYFYFTDKAAAVAALAADMHSETIAATNLMFVRSASPRERIAGSIRATFASWEQHQQVFAAILAARQHNPEVREVWDAARTALVAPVAEMIDTDRAAGLAPDGPDSVTLATVLLELNERSLEQLGVGTGPGVAERIDTLIEVWSRSIYSNTTQEK